MRHRVGISELFLLLVLLAVTAYIAFEIDVFVHQHASAVAPDSIELDEALLLGGLFAIGLLVFSIRRYIEQKRQTEQRRLAERHIRELAFQDPLTGLANRRQFEDSLIAALAAMPGADAIHGVFILDLNGFKQVNDLHGHGVGDQVLVAVAQRLLGAVRAGDLVARLGGDEFAILAQHLAGPEAATNIGLRIIQELESPVRVGSTQYAIAAGIGIATVPNDALTRDEAMRKADVALYRAKAERRSAMRFFEEDMDRLVRERADMEQELRSALAAGDIDAVYVPCIDLTTNQVLGFEAKPYWLHATLGVIDPERFLPIAQEMGLIHSLAAQLLRKACRVAVQWPADINLSIDLFPGQLSDRHLKGGIQAILLETGLAAHRLEIEIPESTLVHQMNEVQEVLGALRDIGVRIALDNFGTGYSSLYHLRNFKIDKVKIDRRFIETMGTDRESAAIVNALIGLGQGLGFTLAADGVEQSNQQQALLGSGCGQGQGHLFSKPIRDEQTVALARR